MTQITYSYNAYKWLNSNDTVIGKSKKSNVKDCLMAVQKQFEGMESPDAADDNSPYKYVLKVGILNHFR